MTCGEKLYIINIQVYYNTLIAGAFDGLNILLNGRYDVRQALSSRFLRIRARDAVFHVASCLFTHVG